MNNRTINFIIQAILQSSNTNKQKLGQRIAYYLGLNPGPRGSDDGIDGFLEKNNIKIHFQSKLRSIKLDKDDARAYFSDIEYHNANISIIVSGVGFKETFIERLFGHKSTENIEIHLLELRDIFENNIKFKNACNSLPELRLLDNEIKNILQ